MNDCVFCKIIDKEIEREILFENEDGIVIESNMPVAQTHLLVIPKNHVETFLDLESEMEGLTRIAQKMVLERNLTAGYKLNVNGGKYQSVMHFHIHILAGKLEDNKDILNNT